jgi:small-conductance mechanosensitive channel
LLDNLGFDISAVIAGLGIGGVAVALASQGILEDLFSYFSILFDRPFELGDFIIVGEFMGTVERVGIKTTRLRSISGEELVLANTDLTGSRLRNYKRMAQRRVAFTIGVTYETGMDRLERIPELIQHVIESVDKTIFGRAHFFSYGDFSLNFEIVYFVTTNDYDVYMDTQQAINLGIKRKFDENGIEFAYPTQVQYLASLSNDALTVSSNGNVSANVS